MKIPELKIAQNVEGTHYAISGWHELDAWARRNSALWAAVTDRCTHSGISEQHRLELLCAALLQKSVMQDELITDMAKKWGGFAPNAGDMQPRTPGPTPQQSRHERSA